MYVIASSTVCLNAETCNTYPPFSTLPKLCAVEELMRDVLGKDIASLRQVATALARKTIFGERSYSLDKSKLDSIRAY